MPLRPVHLRGDSPPARAFLVVRGGRNSLSDEVLLATAEANFEMFGFWALSVFLAPENDLERLSRQVDAIRVRKQVRTAQCGAVRGARFPLLDTTKHPLHFSIVLAEPTPAIFDRLRRCFSPPFANPGYRP